MIWLFIYKDDCVQLTVAVGYHIINFHPDSFSHHQLTDYKYVD